MRASYCKYKLKFYTPATTSREVMTDKETYFLKVWDEADESTFGIGECALFRGLSSDDQPDYEDKLKELCDNIACNKTTDLTAFGSIQFGLETALLDFANGGRRVLFPTSWVAGESEIPINGLVWMGNADEMLRRIDEKLDKGFRCVKLKIGGIDFDEEIALLAHIRDRFSPDKLELRLDANGAFSPKDAMSKLCELSRFDIHSIEQPIKAGQWHDMARLCCDSPIPIALDEELIGVNDVKMKRLLLHTIIPQYIILKPALCGGLSGAREWVELAQSMGIGWWVTSALESNIGLNAIAQWVATLDADMPQGLGTGALYENNFGSPLEQVRDVIRYNPQKSWTIPRLDWCR